MIVKTTMVNTALDTIAIGKTVKAVAGFIGYLLVLAAVGVMAGCTVSTSHRDGHDGGGKNKDVDIRTPFGSLSVHEGAMEAKDTGLSAYPGAQIKKSPVHDEDSSANVNISSSLFGMKLIVLKYETKDSQDKVLDFYRKDLSKYGKVVDCKGNFAMVFNPTGNSEREVSCARQGNGDGEYRQELKVGTESNQRVVGIKPVADGTEFALVYVRTRNEKDTL
jgi:hypothetical protein